MKTVDVSVKLPKESYELSEGLVNTALAIRNALKDGFQPGQDLPVLQSAIFQDLMPAIQGIDDVDDEYKESKLQFLNAWMQSGIRLAEGLGLK